MYKKGEKIFFNDYDGDLIVSRVKEVIYVDGKVLITPEDYDWRTLTETDLLDESDIRVKEYMSLYKDKTISLAGARQWLQTHITDYYEPSGWSNFNEEQAIKDFCLAMLD